MLSGRFGAGTSRPYVESAIWFPRIDVRGKISFLLDTGADQSIVYVNDIKRLRISYDMFCDEMDVAGVGGAMSCFRETAILYFADSESAIRCYRTDVLIPKCDHKIGIPSLLGRDVLGNWKILYCQEENRLEIEVLKADKTISVPTTEPNKR